LEIQDHVGSPDELGPASLAELVQLLREDYVAHRPRAAVSPGFHALAVYRFGRWQRLAPLPRVAQWVLRPLYLVLAYVVQSVHTIELYPAAKVGRRLRIAHRGAVVNGAAEIGDDCILRQYVTIGAVFEGGACPRLGSAVEVGPGAVIIGGVSIGDGAKIGPNAVVTFDVPAAGRVVASPARLAPTAGAAREAASTPPAAERRSDEPTTARVADIVAAVASLDEPPAIDEPLLSSGLVDSLNVARLLEALEEAFGVDISVDDVDAAEFDTVADIAAFLAERS
jgi:serine O-acetyltransferase